MCRSILWRICSWSEAKILWKKWIRHIIYMNFKRIFFLSKTRALFHYISISQGIKIKRQNFSFRNTLKTYWYIFRSTWSGFPYNFWHPIFFLLHFGSHTQWWKTLLDQKIKKNTNERIFRCSYNIYYELIKNYIIRN